MSRLHEALQKSERERRQAAAIAPEPAPPPVRVEEIVKADPPTAQKSRLVSLAIPIESRLVALTEPFGLGAEKFRVLVTRLENLRKKQKELKSLQITSGGIAEGKTLVAGNLALTFAKGSRSKVLLIEGDLHNPKMASVLGLSKLPGVIDWWAGRQDINHSLYQLQDLPLWFLPAGGTHEQPSTILQSPRFAEAFAQLSRQFDWIVVDSTPMAPMVDVNLWSRLVDGTLVVVREGVAPVKALKKGLASLDNPKLVGVVFNDVSELDHAGGYDRYYVRGKSDKNTEMEMEN